MRYASKENAMLWYICCKQMSFHNREIVENPHKGVLYLLLNYNQRICIVDQIALYKILKIRKNS